MKYFTQFTNALENLLDNKSKLFKLYYYQTLLTLFAFSGMTAMMFFKNDFAPFLMSIFNMFFTLGFTSLIVIKGFEIIYNTENKSKNM